MNKVNLVLSMLLKLFGITVCICLCFFLIQLIHMTKDIDSVVKNVQSKDGILDSTNTTIKNINSTVLQVKSDAAVAAWKINGKGSYDGLLTQTYKDLHDIHRVVAIAAENENEYWKDTKTRTNALLDHADEVVRNVNPVLDQTKTDLVSLNTLISDPQIKDSIQNVSDTTKSMAVSSAHIEVVTDNAAKSSTLLEKRLEQMLKPGSLIKNIFMTLLDVGFKARGLLGK